MLDSAGIAVFDIPRTEESGLSFPMRVALNHLWMMTEERTPFLDRIYHFIMGLLECIPYFNRCILTIDHWLFGRAFSLNRKYLRGTILEVSNTSFQAKLYLPHKGGFMSFDISCKDQKYFYKSTLSAATSDHVQITDELEFQTKTLPTNSRADVFKHIIDQICESSDPANPIGQAFLDLDDVFVKKFVNARVQ